MSEPLGPELRAVPDELQTPSSSQPERSERGERRPWVALLLAALLLILGLAYGVERQRATRLESEVAALEVDLRVTQGSLEAAERRMDVVRAHVDDLAARFVLLQEALVESRPAGD